MILVTSDPGATQGGMSQRLTQPQSGSIDLWYARSALRYDRPPARWNERVVHWRIFALWERQ